MNGDRQTLRHQDQIYGTSYAIFAFSLLTIYALHTRVSNAVFLWLLPSKSPVNFARTLLNKLDEKLERKCELFSLYISLQTVCEFIKYSVNVRLTTKMSTARLYIKTLY